MKNINDNNKINKVRSKKAQSGPFCFLMWILKVELIIITIFVCCFGIFYLIPDKTKFIVKYNIDKAFYQPNIKDDNYSFKDIEECINGNKSLSDLEKEFLITNLEDEINENINYIDISKIKSRLEGLKVSYCKKYYYNENINTYEIKYPKFLNVTGRYNTFFNTIYLYDEIDKNLAENYNNQIYNFESCNKIAYFHEINHLLAKNTFQKNNKNVVLETINELFTREYYKQDEIEENSEAYQNTIMYGYALAEILPVEVLKEYKFNSNESILISGLLEIDNNIDEAYNLISGVNSLDLYGESTKENYEKIHNGFSYFYRKKYNKEMTDSLEMLLYFYETPIQTKEERKILREKLEMKVSDEIINIIPKGYVSEDYKKTNSYIKVEYTKFGLTTNTEIIE